MIRANRGEAPEVLEENSTSNGKKELARARDYVSQPKHNNDFKFTAYSHPTVREALRSMFLGKCAYCEHPYEGAFTEDVEHFRPKARIDTENGILRPRYWWLASDWNNLLPSCARCNKTKTLSLFDGTSLKVGKGNRFPLTNENLRATTEGGEINEIPLLIDPTKEYPEKLFKYEILYEKCIIKPESTDLQSIDYRKARTSIDTYGLNRRGLVKERSRTYVSLASSIEQVKLLAMLLPTTPLELKDTVTNKINSERNHILQLTSDSSPFAGMCRWFAKPFLNQVT